MNQINKNIQEKDELFYVDLVCEIKRLAGFNITVDENQINRIEKRKEDVETTINGEIGYLISDFKLELFEFVMAVGELSGTVLPNLEDISKYPDIVNELLKQFEEQPKVLKKKLTHK